MMLTTKFSRRILAGAGILILAAGAAWADGYSSHRWSEPFSFQRFSLSLDGGFGLADGRRGSLDAKAELQFGLTRRIRIGLGVGYAGWDERGEIQLVEVEPGFPAEKAGLKAGDIIVEGWNTNKF